MPHQEAVEQGEKVFIALTCLQKTPYIVESENTNEKENQRDTKENEGSGSN